MYRMRKLGTTFALALAVALTTGCVGSLQPIYTPADVTFDPALLGSWADSSSEDRAEVTQSGKNAYTVAITDKDGTTRYTAHLARIGGRLVLDMLPDTRGLTMTNAYRDALQPLHIFVFVDQLSSRAVLSSLAPDSLSNYLRRRPKATPHALGPDDKVLFTGSTREVQAFLVMYMRRKNVMTEPSVWIRRSP